MDGGQARVFLKALRPAMAAEPLVFKKWRGCILGNATIEFALVLLPALMVICGGFEVAMLAYTRSQLEGAVTRATRMASTGNYNDVVINKFIQDRMKPMRIAAGDVIIHRASYRNFVDVGKPEPVVSDAPPLGGSPSRGDCYEDVNNNNRWDADMGSNTIGRSEDVIRYKVTVRYTMLFTFMSGAFRARDNKIPIVAYAVIKAEPWGDRSSSEVPTVERCIV